MKSEISTTDIIHKNNLFNEKEYFGINMIITEHFSHNPLLKNYSSRLIMVLEIPNDNYHTRNDVFDKKSKIFYKMIILS